MSLAATRLPRERLARLRGAANAKKAGKGITRWHLSSDSMQVIRYVYPAGASFTAHQHPQEQAFFLIKGPVAFMVEDREHVLEPGDAIIVPPNVAHSSRVLSAEPAEGLVVLSPPREH